MSAPDALLGLFAAPMATVPGGRRCCIKPNRESLWHVREGDTDPVELFEPTGEGQHPAVVVVHGFLGADGLDAQRRSVASLDRYLKAS